MLIQMLCVNNYGVLPCSFERFPVELPETIKVNLVPGELASYAQARGDLSLLSLLLFFDLLVSYSGNRCIDLY